MGNNNMDNLTKLKYWSYKILPLVYDDSLSYYEVLSKVTQKINELVDNNNDIPQAITKEITNQLNEEYAVDINGKIESTIKDVTDNATEQIDNLANTTSAKIDNLANTVYNKIVNAIATDEGTSTFTASAKSGGEIIWLNGTLYKVVATMAAGTNYIVGTNIIPIDISEELRDIKETYLSSNNEHWNDRSTSNYDTGVYLYWKDVLYITTKDIKINDILYSDGDSQNIKPVTLAAEITAHYNEMHESDLNLQTQIDGNDGDIEKLQAEDINLQNQITNNNTNVNNRISNIVAQSGTDNTEVVDARKWSAKFGEITSTALGDAIRGQINRAFASASYNAPNLTELDLNNLKEDGAIYYLNSDLKKPLKNAPKGFKLGGDTSILIIFNYPNTPIYQQILLRISTQTTLWSRTGVGNNWSSWSFFQNGGALPINFTAENNTINVYDLISNTGDIVITPSTILTNIPSEFHIGHTSYTAHNETGYFDTDGTWVKSLILSTVGNPVACYRLDNFGSTYRWTFISNIPFNPTNNMAVEDDNYVVDLNNLVFSECPIALFNMNYTNATFKNFPINPTGSTSGVFTITTNLPGTSGESIIKYQYYFPDVSDLTKYYERAQTGPTFNYGKWTLHTPEAKLSNISQITIGVGTNYPTLRAGLEYAYTHSSDDSPLTVYVNPGTYNLIEEFATELSADSVNATGIPLGNSMHVIFSAGAYVTAIYESSGNATKDASVAQNFQPFYNAGTFTLENANIAAQDTRYCIHDERAGQGTYNSNYVNCVMKYTRKNPANQWYVQCIGGGLGEHGHIVVDGGYYETYDEVNDTTQPITYHNGNNASADSTLLFKNVCLGNKGYFRLGCYGPSTTVSQCYVSGCKMSRDVYVMFENDSASIKNFNVTEWNNEITNDSNNTTPSIQANRS